MNEELYSVWENVPTEDRMFFLVNESAMLIWNFNRAGNAEQLKDFRERLRSTLSFADNELYELEVKAKIKALFEDTKGVALNESIAQRLMELSDEIHEYLAEPQEDVRKSA